MPHTQRRQSLGHFIQKYLRLKPSIERRIKEQASKVEHWIIVDDLGQCEGFTWRFNPRTFLPRVTFDHHIQSSASLMRSLRIGVKHNRIISADLKGKTPL